SRTNSRAPPAASSGVTPRQRLKGGFRAHHATVFHVQGRAASWSRTLLQRSMLPEGGAHQALPRAHRRPSPSATRWPEALAGGPWEGLNSFVSAAVSVLGYPRRPEDRHGQLECSPFRLLPWGRKMSREARWVTIRGRWMGRRVFSTEFKRATVQRILSDE